MSADSIALLIAGAAGFFLGGWITVFVAIGWAARVQARTEKQTWAAANLYYTRKETAK